MLRSTVLIISADDAVQQRLAALLAQAATDQCLLLARDGLQGLDLAEHHAHALTLVVLDMPVPLLDGRAVAAELRSLLPALPILPLTSDGAALAAFTRLGCLVAVPKPLDDLTVLAQLHLAFHTPLHPPADPCLVQALRGQVAALRATLAGQTLLPTTKVRQIQYVISTFVPKAQRHERAVRRVMEALRVVTPP